MHTLVANLAQHGYSILFALVFAEAAGFPVPAALALLVAGGASAKGPLQPGFVLLSALAGMLLGDLFLFLLGRHTGWWLLGILCRLSMNPESCILRSAESFYRRGRTLLLFAKFVPGINTLAPPLAGSMNMRFPEFLALDFAGASLYILVYSGAGFVFSDFLATVTAGYQTVGRVFTWVVAISIAIYFGYHIILRLKSREVRAVRRLPPSEIARRLYSELGGNIAVFDVRSHGYYSQKAFRIKGSVRLEPNTLPHHLQSLPKDKEIVLYCTCIRDATSVRVAHVLREHGLLCCVLEGGLRAWKKAGLPLETVPEEDVVMLPTFS
ncbi:MAG: VTT domain-containing protein [Acidobacteriaceae bacterium]|nr:VTT domain-containing protein [Acidobacteriaceae bacterium]